MVPGVTADMRKRRKIDNQPMDAAAIIAAAAQRHLAQLDQPGTSASSSQWSSDYDLRRRVPATVDDGVVPPAQPLLPIVDLTQDDSDDDVIIVEDHVPPNRTPRR